MLRSALSLLVAATLAASAAPDGPVHLVACAPGYPGSTAQAQPTMDAFASRLAAAAGWPAGAVSAEYQESEAGGLERLADPATQIALVPLPFFLAHEAELGLRPLAQVIGPDGEATETWSLVAPAGRLRDAAGLAGWTVIGMPTYAPAFVRGPVLAGWGELPEDVELEFSRRILSGIRRATAGEQVAVLLDRAQTAALGALPDPEALEIVAASPPLPSAYVVEVGGRLDDATRATLVTALLDLHSAAASADVLSTAQVQRFDRVDEAALRSAREAYAAAR